VAKRNIKGDVFLFLFRSIKRQHQHITMTLSVGEIVAIVGLPAAVAGLALMFWNARTTQQSYDLLVCHSFLISMILHHRSETLLCIFTSSCCRVVNTATLHVS
jgi:hypothetical protein